jgi:glycosyltransferase involved in cell wall biosynthesis
MHSKKINIFLGGFINLTNAQNLNCLALAKHLDKEKFSCYSLELYSGNLKSHKGKIEGLNVFKCFYPARISMYLGFLWGIWKCDVAYLPKGELWRWNRFWLKVFRKISFSTMEGIIDETALQNIVDALGSKSNYLTSRLYFDKQYSITSYMSRYNYDNLGIQTEKKILYLGVDALPFYNDSQKSSLNTILMVGNDLVRKGVLDYLELAKSFPQLTFSIAGSGNGKIDIDLEISKRKLTNVFYKGMLATNELIDLLKMTDLHILPSRSEGFPKVILETAAAGVPSLVYSDYGANEWITHNHNGFVVETLEHMIEVINRLIGDPELLQTNSHNSIELAKQFDWQILIKIWEKVMEDLINE